MSENFCELLLFVLSEQKLQTTLVQSFSLPFPRQPVPHGQRAQESKGTGGAMGSDG